VAYVDSEFIRGEGTACTIRWFETGRWRRNLELGATGISAGVPLCDLRLGLMFLPFLHAAQRHDEFEPGLIEYHHNLCLFDFRSASHLDSPGARNKIPCIAYGIRPMAIALQVGTLFPIPH
jgi:hypothetical protein